MAVGISRWQAARQVDPQGLHATLKKALGPKARGQEELKALVGGNGLQGAWQMAFDQALGSVIKQLVAFTMRTPQPRPPGEDAPYNIERYRNPANSVVDSQNCPVGNDASRVPYADE